MHMAAEAGHVEVIKLLVESGASPRAESLVSWTVIKDGSKRTNDITSLHSQ